MADQIGARASHAHRDFIKMAFFGALAGHPLPIQPLSEVFKLNLSADHGRFQNKVGLNGLYRLPVGDQMVQFQRVIATFEFVTQYRVAQHFSNF